MTRKNTRSLDAIADDIYRVAKHSVIEIGELLNEARPLCEHGQWIDWLLTNGWSTSSADRYMKVAELASNFPKLGNMRLAKTTLYALVDHDVEEELPAIIAELAKHSTKARLDPHDAKRVIQIGIGRHRFGNFPDATLFWLERLHNDSPWYEEAVTALKEKKPATDEAADTIVSGIHQAFLAKTRAEAKADAAEAEEILNGPSPQLAPSQSGQGQRFPLVEEEEDEEEPEPEEEPAGLPPPLPLSYFSTRLLNLAAVIIQRSKQGDFGLEELDQLATDLTGRGDELGSVVDARRRS